MWYKIPFTYKDFSTGYAIAQDADLMLDLPQVKLSEAKNNLFVRDVVRHPAIKSCYVGDASYNKAPEDILQSCGQEQNVNDLIKVPVRYQRDPFLVANIGHSFLFNVYIDNFGASGAFLPKTFDFTCRADYDYYYEAFMNDMLVDTGVWGPVGFEDGAIVKVFVGNGFEIAKVHQDKEGKPFARMLPPSSGEIGINHLTLSCIRSIDLSNDILMCLSSRYVSGYIGNVYTYWYEITLADSQSTIIKFSRTRLGQYCLIVEDDCRSEGPSYKIVPFVGLDGLQRAIKEQYGISYCPSDSALEKISLTVRAAYPNQQFLAGLLRIIESHGTGADYDKVLAEVCSKYKVSASDAAFYLSGFKMRGYFAEHS